MKNYKEYNKLIENAEFCLQKGNKTQAIHFYKEAQKVAPTDAKRNVLEHNIHILLNHDIDEAIGETDVINLRENLKDISDESK